MQDITYNKYTLIAVMMDTCFRDIVLSEKEGNLVKYDIKDEIEEITLERVEGSL